jgi:hypothetical protein
VGGGVAATGTYAVGGAYAAVGPVAATGTYAMGGAYAAVGSVVLVTLVTLC